MLTLRPNPAISQAPVVVPRLAPKMIPMPAASDSNPALRNEIVMTETRELDCIRVVVTTPNDRLFQTLSVVRAEQPFEYSAREGLEPLFQGQHAKQEDGHARGDLLEIWADPKAVAQDAENGG